MNLHETKEEALYRMERLGASKKAIKMYKNGSTPVTTLFGGVSAELNNVHLEALSAFKKCMPDAEVFYVVEFWELTDIISILFVDPAENDDDLEFEHDSIEEGWSTIYAYAPKLQYGEFGSGHFFSKDNTLYRDA